MASADRLVSALKRLEALEAAPRQIDGTYEITISGQPKEPAPCPSCEALRARLSEERAARQRAEAEWNEDTAGIDAMFADVQRAQFAAEARSARLEEALRHYRDTLGHPASEVARAALAESPEEAS